MRSSIVSRRDCAGIENVICSRIHAFPVATMQSRWRMGVFGLLSKLKWIARALQRRPASKLSSAKPGNHPSARVGTNNFSHVRPQVTLEPIAQRVVGRCWVIDGDSIKINNIEIRLSGIDAPELDHPYGKLAKAALIKLCNGQEVTATCDGNGKYGRVTATCFLPDGRDLSAEMVKMGLALDWRKFSGGRYQQFEPVGVRKKLWRVDGRQKKLMHQYDPNRHQVAKQSEMSPSIE
jgi:micrococcal nuclease